MNDMNQQDMEERVRNLYKFTQDLKVDCTTFMRNEVKNKMRRGMEKIEMKERSVGDVSDMWAQLGDKRHRDAAGKKLIKLIKVGGAFKKGWEEKAAQKYMTKYGTKYEYKKNMSKTKRRNKGCIAKMASRQLINARKNMFRKGKEGHGWFVSANSVKVWLKGSGEGDKKNKKKWIKKFKGKRKVSNPNVWPTR